MGSLVFRNYPHQNYKVIFNQSTGFFARIEDKSFNEPFWAEKGPELLDISITNWCDNGCSFCYKRSDKFGRNMTLDDYKLIMEYASKSNVFQVALGGGNPNQHPDFIDIIRMTKENYNIVPSYTTNGRGLTDDILIATKKYCGAVAISAYFPYDELMNSLNILYEYEIKTNIHFLLSNNTIRTAIHWLKEDRSVLDKCNAVIFLNYKPVGRIKNNKLLLNNSSLIKEFFSLADLKYPFKIGFDSCMVSGVVKNMKNVNSLYIEPCEAARFSAYISEDLQMYPCSFMNEYYKGEDLRKNSLTKIWTESKSFNETRKRLENNGCQSCVSQKLCLGGCPFLNIINLC